MMPNNIPYAINELCKKLGYFTAMKKLRDSLDKLAWTIQEAIDGETPDLKEDDIAYHAITPRFDPDDATAIFKEILQDYAATRPKLKDLINDILEATDFIDAYGKNNVFQHFLFEFDRDKCEFVKGKAVNPSDYNYLLDFTWNRLREIMAFDLNDCFCVDNDGYLADIDVDETVKALQWIAEKAKAEADSDAESAK